jgi:regulator of sigma E protease
MQMLKTVFVFLEVLLLFNLLIFVHELGHFLAARWRGLKVERFAVWFGTPIWKKRINGVEYALGTIPAGGYVSLPQMASMEAIEGKTESSAEQLPPITALDKIIVAFAGPLFSFSLAILFAVVVWAVGRPGGDVDHSTTIGWVEANGPAWKAGLRPGDKVIDIDGHKVTQFAPPAEDSVTWRIVSSEGTNIVFNYTRDGVEHKAYAQVYKRPTKWYERKALRQVLIRPEQPAIIYEVATNSPAALAGLKTGDKILAVNGEKIYSPEAVVQAEESMTNGPVKPIALTIQRGSEKFDKVLTAEKPMKPVDSGPLLGITGWLGATNETLEYPSPIEQIRASVGQIVSTVRVVFSPKTDIGPGQLGGAVMIIRLYSNLFDSENGWRRVLWFSVVLNVNLALLNLLPLPVLDGGHITLALIEVIRRRPVSAKFVQIVQTTFAVLLITFMLVIAFFDTGDWVRSARNNHEEPVCFAPK